MIVIRDQDYVRDAMKRFREVLEDADFQSRCVVSDFNRLGRILDDLHYAIRESDGREDYAVAP